MAQQLGNRMDRFAEAVLPALFNLIPNSAKIMSTSGCVCIRFIIQVSREGCGEDVLQRAGMSILLRNIHCRKESEMRQKKIILKERMKACL